MIKDAESRAACAAARARGDGGQPAQQRLPVHRQRRYRGAHRAGPRQACATPASACRAKRCSGRSIRSIAPTSDTGGMGMGLSIVRRLGERFGWPVVLESVPGSGTTGDDPVRPLNPRNLRLARAVNAPHDRAFASSTPLSRTRPLSAWLLPVPRPPARRVSPSRRVPWRSSSSLVALVGAGWWWSQRKAAGRRRRVPHRGGRARRHPRGDLRHRHAERDLHRRCRQPDLRPGDRRAGRLQRPRATKAR